MTPATEIILYTAAHYALYGMAIPAWVMVAGLMLIVLRDWWRQ